MNQRLFAEGAGPFDPANMPLFLLAIMILFWIVFILPMSRRQRKEQEQMLASLKRGAKVVTTAGILGTIIQADDGKEEIVIRSEDTKLKILRSAVLRVLDVGDGTDTSKTT